MSAFPGEEIDEDGPSGSQGAGSDYIRHLFGTDSSATPSKGREPSIDRRGGPAAVVQDRLNPDAMIVQDSLNPDAEWSSPDKLQKRKKKHHNSPKKQKHKKQKTPQKPNKVCAV